MTLVPDVRIGRTWLAALVLCTACGEGHSLRYGPGELDHEALSPVRLQGTVLAEAGLARPSSVALWGDTVGVLDDAADSVVFLFDATSGKLIRAFGRRGSGPGEFRAAWGFIASPHGAPWVYDVGLARLTAPAPRGPGAMITLRSPGKPTSGAWVSDSEFVASGFFSGGRLAYFDTAGTLRRSVGEVPSAGGDVPLGVRQEAFIGTIVRRPGDGELALVTRHADRIELYRSDGALLKVVKGPFSFSPVFTVAQGRRGPVMASDDALRFGYIEAAATQTAIYALFSGRTREAFHGDAPFGRFVHVYDWSGELKRVLRLDSDVIAIAVDPAEHVLYAVRHDPTPAVLTYDLPR